MNFTSKFIVLPLIFTVMLMASPQQSFANELAQNVVSHTVHIAKRQVTGKNTFRATQGDQISLQWKTDEKVDLHLHGYDIELTATPGTPALMNFIAKATGRFPVTSHGFGGTKGHSHGSGALFYIEVHPKLRTARD